MERRQFLTSSLAGAAALSALGPAAMTARAEETAPKWKKAILHNMLPSDMTDEERFQLAKRCGYQGIEGQPMDDLDAARAQADLARKIGVPIHSLLFGWVAFSDPNQEVIDRGLRGMEAALRNAAAIGADAVLLVPAIVTENMCYSEAYEKSQVQVRKLIPLAEELKVTIAIENVWNRFLLSPLEFARYLDELDSPYVKAYFDVGNIILYGFSQHWIRILNKRLAKVHLKDFKRQGYQWTNLGDGDVNWAEVRKALIEVGYDDYLTVELGGGDEEYLTDISQRIDRLLEL